MVLLVRETGSVASAVQKTRALSCNLKEKGVMSEGHLREVQGLSVLQGCGRGMNVMSREVQVPWTSKHVLSRAIRITPYNLFASVPCLRSIYL